MRVDFDLPREKNKNVGVFAMIFGNQRELVGYGFFSDKGGSIGMPVSRPGVLQDPETRAKTQSQLRAIAARFGVDPQYFAKTYEYSGNLIQTDRVNQGHIYILADAARTTDPGPGNGLNTALRDARLLRTFYTQKSRGLADAEKSLIENLKANTRYTFRNSLHFQDLLQWIKSEPKASMLLSAGIPALDSVNDLSLPLLQRRPPGRSPTLVSEKLMKQAFISFAELAPTPIMRAVTRATLSTAGAPVPYEQGGADKIAGIPIHEGASFNRTKCIESIIERSAK